MVDVDSGVFSWKIVPEPKELYCLRNIFVGNDVANNGMEFQSRDAGNNFVIMRKTIRWKADF